MSMLSEIAETLRPVLREASRFLEECGRREPCDLADPALVMEARILTPMAPEEPEAAESRAELRLAPTIGGDELLEILSWARERAAITSASGRGVEISLGLSAPWTEAALRAVEQVAWSLRGLLGPGVQVIVTGVLDENGKTRWSVSLHICALVGQDPSELAEHGVHAALAIVKALRVSSETLASLHIETSSEILTSPVSGEYMCTGIRLNI